MPNILRIAARACVEVLVPGFSVFLHISHAILQCHRRYNNLPRKIESLRLPRALDLRNLILTNLISRLARNSEQDTQVVKSAP